MSAILEPMPEAPPQTVRGVPDEAAARQWCRERRIDDIECIIPDQAGVARGKLMPTPKVLRRQPDDAAGLDVHPDHHRRISGGGGGLHRGPHRQRPDLPPGFRHARGGALGERPDRAGDPRRLPQGRHALRDRAAQRAEAHRAALCRPRHEAGRGAGDGILSRQAEHRSRLSAGAAGRPLGPAGARPPGLFDHRGQRVRGAVRRHLPLLRGAGAGDRHAEPRGRHGADGDQPAPRRSGRARRPGVPVQADDPRGGAPPQDVRDLHGQADRHRARLGHAHPPFGHQTWRPAGTSSPTSGPASSPRLP